MVGTRDNERTLAETRRRAGAGAGGKQAPLLHHCGHAQLPRGQGRDWNPGLWIQKATMKRLLLGSVGIHCPSI